MEERLIHFIKTEILEDTSAVINKKDELLMDGTINSLGLMRLVRFIERQSNVQVPFEDITPENFMTIEHMVSYINKVKN
ncbi:acyl carrier protein [Hyunsoonleella ulvae]|uniref:acyl carrier protein n=1 Tax=Hyunsoonleella ulvae TaxID=2799948 RepID=UPI00193A1273|nr:acyl carrier protein [Hyunsoonleella ulvae]